MTLKEAISQAWSINDIMGLETVVKSGAFVVQK